MQIDARGKSCPQPVLMAEDALSKIEEGILEVIVDNEDSALNVAGFAAQKALFAETKQEGGDWKVKIVKGYTCNSNADCGMRNAESKETKKDLHPKAEPEQKKKTLFLVIGTDSLGKDEDLGKKLVKGFFDTMNVTKQLPHTLFFLNAGVKLTTVNDEIVGVLKEIEALGVEIYSCGSCLKHYNLDSELKVGDRGTIIQTVEGMHEFEKVVWI
jgi:selenium metabolism protein YedF